MKFLSQRKSKGTDTSDVSLLELHPESPSSPRITTSEILDGRRNLQWMLRPGIWLFEIVTLLIAATGLIALIFVLQAYNGKPNPKWSLHLTLNTTVSLISTLFRFCILFAVSRCIGQNGWLLFAGKQHRLDDYVSYDSASRGPLGSIQLLIRARAR